MRVAVVILNWNGKLFLEKFLQNVLDCSQQATVYVADNASSDGSMEYVRTNFPSVVLIDNKENWGFAGGYNVALNGLNEEFFVLLNSDVEVSQDWLTPLIKLLDSDSKIAACQPKVLAYNQQSHFEYAGACGGFIDKFGYPFCRGRIFDSLEEDNGQHDSTKEVFWATGASMFVRSTVYKELGGLDADFFAHMEEIDFCWRAKRAGYKIMVEPKSVVYHVGGGTLSRSNPWKTFLNFRNGLELLAKNLPKHILWQTLFLRMVLDGVAAFKFLLGGQPKDFWAVLKAHAAFYIRLKTTLNKRTGDYSPVSRLYSKSIVWEYFVKGRKLFTDLPSNNFL